MVSNKKYCSSVGGDDDHCLIFVEEGVDMDGGCGGNLSDRSSHGIVLDTEGRG